MLIIADVMEASHFRGLVQALKMKGSFTKNSAFMSKLVYDPEGYKQQAIDYLQNLPQLQFKVIKEVDRSMSGLYVSSTYLQDADEDNLVIVTVSASKSPAVTSVSVLSLAM
jgi:hypothetical protein